MVRVTSRTSLLLSPKGSIHYQFKTIPTAKMPTDAALFEEVAALLGSNATPVARSHSKSVRPGLPVQIPEDALLLTESRASSSVTPQRQVLKRIIREEKEAIRKRQYHQRVKVERDSLRQKVEALSTKLRELQQGKCRQKRGPGPDAFLQNSSSWKGLAKYQRDQRKKAETEQTRLFAAAKMQAAYIGQLCERLPGSSRSTTCIHVDRNQADGGEQSNRVES
ncbi:hypothetical protein PR002_g5079 [Phytophthora rubi]|uniref:Uncharacterized protein n=2 Tax=Phytophthora rubi TaxID=129364 RepID=A0A6A3N483_9STRA|nr:hypothetical protein PR002_g5079 [Phytophthora rubi]